MTSQGQWHVRPTFAQSSRSACGRELHAKNDRRARLGTRAVLRRRSAPSANQHPRRGPARPAGPGSAPHVQVNAQRVVHNHRSSEVEPHVAPRRPQLHPPRHHPAARAPDRTSALVDPDHVLGLRRCLARQADPATRSAVNMASSPRVREDKAASRRSSSSSGVSRPSPAATRSTSMTQSGPHQRPPFGPRARSGRLTGQPEACRHISSPCRSRLRVSRRSTYPAGPRYIV